MPSLMLTKKPVTVIVIVHHVPLIGHVSCLFFVCGTCLDGITSLHTPAARSSPVTPVIHQSEVNPNHRWGTMTRSYVTCLTSLRYMTPWRLMRILRVCWRTRRTTRPPSDHGIVCKHHAPHMLGQNTFTVSVEMFSGSTISMHLLRFATPAC